MINAHHINHLVKMTDPFYPPFKTGFFMLGPVINGMSPYLSCFNKKVWWTAGLPDHMSSLIQFKQVLVGPDICAVVGYVIGNIANDPDTLAAGILF